MSIIETNVKHMVFFDPHREPERGRNLFRLEQKQAYGSTPFELTRDEQLLRRLGWLVAMADPAEDMAAHNFVRAWLERN